MGSTGEIDQKGQLTSIYLPLRSRELGAWEGPATAISSPRKSGGNDPSLRACLHCWSFQKTNSFLFVF